MTDRLHRKGLIADPVNKANSLVLTDEGLQLSEELSARCSRGLGHKDLAGLPICHRLGMGTLDRRAKGALTHSRCDHGLSCTDETRRREQINLGAAVRLPLHEFELGNLAFSLAAPWRYDGIADRGDVFLDAVREGADETYLSA